MRPVSKSSRLMTALTLACLTFGIALVPTASAVTRTWNTIDNPLVVKGYGSTGYAYGDWAPQTRSAGTRSTFWPRVRINDADNHTVYATGETWVNAGVCIAPEYTSCSAKYYYHAKTSTPHYSGSVYKKYTITTSLSQRADYARGHVYLNLDIPLRPDPYVGPSITRGLPY